jgi:hypothetical protein
MATVRLQNGKVILKDKKVSCSCCEEPECCMYPAQALADGQYIEDDLPGAVTIDGTSFDRSGTGYGNTTNGVILDENVWAKYRNGARSNRPCLIQGGVVDQFAGTYTVTIFFEVGSVTSTVTRISLCEWEGPAIIEGGNPVTLRYLADELNEPPNFLYKWFVDARGVLRQKEGFMNTPLGNYQTEFQGEIAVTVS